MDWREVSEINFGRLIKGDITPTRFHKNMFFPPYDRGFDIYTMGGDKGSIVKEIGLDHYQSSLYARAELNGAGDDVDWADLLEKSAARWQASEELERIAKKLKDNEEPDWSKIHTISANAQAGMAGKFISLDDVWYDEPEENWQESGIKFIDYWIGGWPKYGLFTIGGRAKSGKTTFTMSAIVGYVKKNPDKNVVVYTIEMFVQQFKDRLKELEISGLLTSDERKRILLCEHPVNPEEAISWASAIPDVGIIFIDYADLMIPGEVTEPKMTAAYRTLTNGSKQLRTAIGLVAQFSRGYQGGIPRPYHIRYTGIAEAAVVLQLMLYVPFTDSFEPKETEILPVYTDAGYVIKWFSRYKTNREAGMPHAILVPFDEAAGWKINIKGEMFKVK
jgi:hypothetical protein